MTRWRTGAAALLVGLALAVGLALHVGIEGLRQAVAHVGLGRFLLYCLYSTAVFVPLGVAWWAVAPPESWRRSGVFVWARLLREAASDILPFSQLGGLVVGIRVVRRGGVAEALAVGSMVIDLTAEMASQLVYTLFGVATLATAAPAMGQTGMLPAAIVALVAGAALLLVFVAVQQRGVDFAGRMLSRWLKDITSRAAAVRSVIADIRRRPGRLAAGFALHVASWVFSGAGSWLALIFLGAHLSLLQVMTLESLVSAVRSAAFMTPGGLGFQEGAYVVAAPLFGLDVESALALSLLKRAKDLAIGVPALLLWQAIEGRRLAKADSVALQNERH